MALSGLGTDGNGKSPVSGCSKTLMTSGIHSVSLSSMGGNTCFIWPLCTPEWLATSVHHLDMANSGEDINKPETERRSNVSGFK